MTNLLHRTGRFAVVHNQYWKIPLSKPSALATHVWRLCVVYLGWSAHLLCGQQHLKYEWAVCVIYPPFFVNFALHPTPQRKGVRFGSLGGQWMGPAQPFHWPRKVSFRYCFAGQVEDRGAPSCWYTYHSL
jgi:hypothetical protein